MDVDAVMRFRRAVPFQPFVVQLRDGRRFVVSQPEQIARDVAKTRITVAAGDDSFESFPGSAVAAVRSLQDDIEERRQQRRGS